MYHVNELVGNAPTCTTVVAAVYMYIIGLLQLPFSHIIPYLAPSISCCSFRWLVFGRLLSVAVEQRGNRASASCLPVL